MNRARAPVRPGDVIRVGEPDYRYGVGLLILRITEVGELEQRSGGAWVHLHGVELRPDGGARESESRPVVVRVSAGRPGCANSASTADSRSSSTMSSTP
jgi:hypothetical protein